MRIVISALLFFGGASLGYGLAYWNNPTPPALEGEREVVLSDLNDLALMRHMHLLRDGELADGREIRRINYSFFEDDNYASNAWLQSSDFLLLHPTASAGLYSIYRMIQHDAQSAEALITDRQRNWLISMLASAQHLSLLERRTDLYDALVAAQLCITPALANDTWGPLAAKCLPALQKDVYRLLKIDPDYVVDNGSEAFLD